jgi:hypothetical protein
MRRGRHDGARLGAWHVVRGRRGTASGSISWIIADAERRGEDALDCTCANENTSSSK